MRDEAEQATHLRELLEVFEAEGSTPLVYTSARYDLPHRQGARADLDLASRGVVKVLDGRSGAGGRRCAMPWEPKAACAALADRSGR